MQVAEALARSLGSSKLLVRAEEQHALILGVPELERLSLDFAPLAAQGFGVSSLVVRPQQLAAFLFGAPEFVVTVLRSQAPTREDLAQVAREEQFAKVPFEEWLAKVRQ